MFFDILSGTIYCEHFSLCMNLNMLTLSIIARIWISIFKVVLIFDVKFRILLPKSIQLDFLQLSASLLQANHRNKQLWSLV